MEYSPPTSTEDSPDDGGPYLNHHHQVNHQQQLEDSPDPYLYNYQTGNDDFEYAQQGYPAMMFNGNGKSSNNNTGSGSRRQTTQPASALTANGRKRKHATQACDYCSRRKVRCDGAKPTCATCSERGVGDQCTYGRVQRRRGPKSSPAAALKLRVQELILQLKTILEQGPEALNMLRDEGGLELLSNTIQASGGVASTATNNNSNSRRKSSGADASPLNQLVRAAAMSEQTFTLRPPVISHPTVLYFPSKDNNPSLLPPMNANVADLMSPRHNQVVSEMLEIIWFLETDQEGPQLLDAEAPSRKRKKRRGGDVDEAGIMGERSIPIPRGLDDGPIELDLPLEVYQNVLDYFFEHLYEIKLTVCGVNKNMIPTDLTRFSPFLLNCICAIAYLERPFTGHEPPALPIGWNGSEAFYARARSLMPRFLERPSLDTVNAFHLLVEYTGHMGESSLAWMYSGMAIRMSQGLGLFTARYPVHLPWWIRERCRRIAWADFIIDRLTSAFADRPSLLKEYEVAQVPLPSVEAAWEATQPNDPNPPAGFSEHGGLITEGIAPPNTKHTITQIISLSRVMGRILGHVGKQQAQTAATIASENNSNSNEPLTNGKSLSASSSASAPFFMLGGDADTADDINSRDLADLDAQLFRWRSRVPPHLLPPSPHAPLPQDLQWDVAFLWLYYATCVCTLHRPHAVKDLKTNTVSSVSFEACRVAAVDATRAIEWITSMQDGKFINGSPYQFVCVIQTGLVHLLVAKSSTNPSHVATARQAINLHMSVLERSGQFRAARRLHRVMASVITQVESSPNKVEELNGRHHEDDVIKEETGGENGYDA
ncbi:hypothetical protein SmJEL517_g04121 [Synchytrium microbalum]|uniref:Zn(2)-C6 fungal-type domain-containing protein n=1 Tax=Synchytrium microbalum TaxID=1806994 RepID=A0A507C5U5_9FUNG|nr:uncharacterized protein SmJEL517_g04121 [Synchytrium microbalum]TPX32845.1 hypothetical protein SmJEL517_g04121 [Synchytrium microbalum]